MHARIQVAARSYVHIHVCDVIPAEKILNGVKWTDALTQQFKVNAQNNSALTWQYFCSSDGFFRIFPGLSLVYTPPPSQTFPVEPSAQTAHVM